MLGFKVHLFEQDEHGIIIIIIIIIIFFLNDKGKSLFNTHKKDLCTVLHLKRIKFVP